MTPEEIAAEHLKVQEALEKAAPNYLRDGHGLRGLQQPTAPQIDGLDGYGNSLQAKRNRVSAETGGGSGVATPPPILNLRVRLLVENGGVVSPETWDIHGEPA